MGEEIFWSKRMLGAKKNLGPKKILGPKKFGSELKFGSKKNWAQKFGSENFLGLVLVLLVTWTPNPLYSAKSP